MFKLHGAAAQGLHQHWAGPGQALKGLSGCGVCVCVCVHPAYCPAGASHAAACLRFRPPDQLSKAFCSILSFQEKQRSSDENQSLHESARGVMPLLLSCPLCVQLAAKLGRCFAAQLLRAFCSILSFQEKQRSKEDTQSLGGTLPCVMHTMCMWDRARTASALPLQQPAVPC